MTYPWEGDQRPISPGLFAEVAQALNVEMAVLRAVLDVESGGGYWDEFGVSSRFEPHKMAPPIGTWRDSLKISAARRHEMLLDAYALNAEAALRATSWGAAQIMGFNHIHTGYPTAYAMVEAMAYSADNHIRIFAAYITSAQLATHLRAKNWRAFARGYNGRGKVRDYAAKLERAYRRRSGRASALVLSVGSSGRQVMKLQRMLHIKADGHFGAETQQAVKRFQRERGLESDGVVGAKTWAVLLPARDGHQPPAKKLNWIKLMISAIMEWIGGSHEIYGREKNI